MENDVPRMVKTPWSEEEIPFEVAAEVGTKKVITEHSTIGILVTTDGSITEIPREDYIEAEERVVRELKGLNKPFVMILNTRYPNDMETLELTKILEEKYETTVIPMSCIDMNEEDINQIFSKLLYEFMIEKIDIKFPRWLEGLDLNSDLKLSLFSLLEIHIKFFQKCHLHLPYLN